jgi:hypothetical protein
MSVIRKANGFVSAHLRIFEMIGVIMRIISFTLVSWMGPESPFLFVWTFNTADAILLTWCASLKRDPAYILLNTFWILVGILGMARAAGYLG